MDSKKAWTVADRRADEVEGEALVGGEGPRGCCWGDGYGEAAFVVGWRRFGVCQVRCVGSDGSLQHMASQDWAVDRKRSSARPQRSMQLSPRAARPPAVHAHSTLWNSRHTISPVLTIGKKQAFPMATRVCAVPALDSKSVGRVDFPCFQAGQAINTGFGILIMDLTSSRTTWCIDLMRREPLCCIRARKTGSWCEAGAHASPSLEEQNRQPLAPSNLFTYVCNHTSG